DFTWPARHAGSDSALPRIRRHASNFDLQLTASAASVGPVVRHGISWPSARPLWAAKRARTISFVSRTDFSRKTPRSCDRDRQASRNSAQDRRESGREGPALYEK